MKKKKLKKADIKRNEGVQIKSIVHRMKMREVELTIASVFSIVVIILSITLVITTSVQKHQDYNKIKSGNIKIVFNETKNNIDDIINLNKKNILSDKLGLESKAHNFIVENKSNNKKKYIIKIVNDDDFIDADMCKNKLIDRKYIRYSIDSNNPKTLGDEEVIFTSNINKKDKINHNIRVWIDENYQGNRDFHYHGKIIIEQIKSK